MISKPDCIFCKIVSKTVPAYVVYEDEQFIAFLDVFPKTWGHTLLIPKEHHRWVWDVPNVVEYFAVVNQIIQHYKQVLQIETCYQSVWGNEISHAHVQIMPKYKEFGKSHPLNDGEAKEMVERLKFIS